MAVHLLGVCRRRQDGKQAQRRLAGKASHAPEVLELTPAVSILEITPIPAVQLVPTVGTKDYLHAVFLGELRHVGRGNAGAIAVGLVVDIEETVQDWRGLAGGQPSFGMAGPQMLSDLPRGA